MQTRILKIIVMTLSCGVAMNAQAIGEGFYLGIMMGPAANNAPSLQATMPLSSDTATTFNTTIANPRSNMFVTRVFMGNQFNPYAGIEWGATFFSSLRYDARGVQTQGSLDQRVRDLDLVAKGMFPFRSVEIYGKAGVAATYITTGGAFNPEFKPFNPPNTPVATLNTSTTYKHKFSPTFSVGAGYDINQSWVVDFSYNMLSVGNNIGSLAFFALGISYHFTNKYCGQFLCDD